MAIPQLTAEVLLAGLQLNNPFSAVL